MQSQLKSLKLKLPLLSFLLLSLLALGSSPAVATTQPSKSDSSDTLKLVTSESRFDVTDIDKVEVELAQNLSPEVIYSSDIGEDELLLSVTTVESNDQQSLGSTRAVTFYDDRIQIRQTGSYGCQLKKLFGRAIHGSTRSQLNTKCYTDVSITLPAQSDVKVYYWGELISR